ncbi:MAG: thiamine phosphate synthase [gamma proteobacterium symbiont of Lucinoma myriamae]|nr:thiamine phosphate synthase [gamma proteobacterium symbiont of Lucinoma myriamae]MCU7818393.1 thiamine phosphate synthase [gamma proteobacterium symbiont of Lucinoma myriamae]MCU7831444.1 thiamine phosphate synthase [gamma proteobacterium symbiont of Lucinoma myriamae]
MSLSSENTTKIHGLYAITDPDLIPAEQLLTSVEQVILGGARIIQYRNKSASKAIQYEEASQLSSLCKQHQICFIINDDPQLAKAVNADGVHVGKEDGKIADARKQLGKQAIIGVSCYNQLENAQRSIEQGADYVAFGRFFPSKTKPDAVQADLQLLKEASQQLNVPIVAIGGINRDNAQKLIQCGASSVAVINDLFHKNQEIYTTAKKYQAFFN